MTLEQIKKELSAGNKVYSQSLLYEVVYNSNVDDYYIVCTANKSKIGLYWIDGSGKTQLSGCDFFVVKPEAMKARDIIEATNNLSWEDGNKFIETQTNLKLDLIVEDNFQKLWSVENSREFSTITNYKSDLIYKMSDVKFGFYMYGCGQL